MIDATFEYGDTVYLKADKEQRKYIITALLYRGQLVLYEVSGESGSEWRQDIELTDSEDQMYKLR